MSINPSLVQEMIAQDTRSCQQLKELMVQERQLLEARHHEPLPALIEQKDQLLDLLSQSSRQRQQLLQRLGLKSDADSWVELLKAHQALSNCANCSRNAKL
jgi:flagellar biosynthesis/type III secretory pathway chaperone